MRAEFAQNRQLGLAIAGLPARRLTGLQLAKVQRAAQLLPRARAALSDFEADLVEEVAARVAGDGWSARVTENEWHVLDTSIDAMDALLAEAPNRG